MADHRAPKPAEPRESDYRRRVVQWGEQQILKDYTLHIDHRAQSGMWRGASPLAITYAQALVIYEALQEEYPDAFDVEGPPDRGAELGIPSKAGDEERAGPPEEHASGAENYTNGVHSPSGLEESARSPEEPSRSSEEHPPPQSRAASGAPYSNTVHYEDVPYEAINIAREVVLTDSDWGGPHRPSLHVHEEGALLKMSGHPITEFTSPRALRAMAALFARAASELERGGG